MGLFTRLRSALGAAAMAATLLATAVPLAAQATGTIRGRVTDAANQRALAGANVTAGGRTTVTNAEGNYTVTVPAGAVTVRVSTLGYAGSSRTVNVAAGQSATADFALSASAINLEGLVITGTAGAQERREIGNAVTQVNAADITDKAPISTVTQLLQGRAPGLTIMQPSGSVGTAASFRIRGTGSLQAGNQPIFYIDGVRMYAGGQTSFGVGGQGSSFLDALNPDDIESIEVIKGPAAATLYGAEAAAGVIQVITKKGRTGRQSLTFSSKAEMGTNSWEEPMLTQYTLCDQANQRLKYLRPGGVASNPADSLFAFTGCQGVPVNTILTDQPLRRQGLQTGDIRTLNAGVRGGGERFSFYVSGDREEEEGIFVNNFFNRTSGRANFFATPSDYLDVTANLQLSTTEVQLPLNDNASSGWMRNAYRGKPGWFIQGTSYAEGWLGLGPEQMSLFDNQRNGDRFILGMTANYQPTKWLRNRLTAGLDANQYRNIEFYKIDETGRAPYGAIAATGAKYVYQPELRLWTLDYAGTISNNLRSDLTSNLSFGMQLNANKSRNWQVNCEGLLSNQLTDCDQTRTRQVFEGFSEQNSLGYFVQEQIGWRDRLHVTGALRIDDNSAFGNEFSLVAYPKASVAWVISEEPFFNVSAFDNLKLRAAWGQAGNSPAPFTATRSFTGAVVAVDQSLESPVSTIRAGAYGNPNLKAETGSELELGFDASLFEGRVGAEVTYYNKSTFDALIGVPVIPSSGFGGSILQNIGEINNRGLELSVFGTPVQGRNVVWETQVGFSTNRNEFVEFGDTSLAGFTVGYSSSQRIAEGFPMAGYWARKPLLDANGNVQIVGASRQALLEDTAVFIGSAIPTKEASLTNTVTLFGTLRLYAFMDYKGGHYLFNMTQQTRNLDRVSDVTNLPADQTDSTQYYLLRTSANIHSYIQPADFIKLRELSATYTVPQRVTRRFGTDNLSFSLAGRNLSTLWTRYPGPDPEVNIEGADAFTRGDYMSTPMLRRVVATVSVSF